MNLEDFKARVKRADWLYTFSDCQKTYQRGRLECMALAAEADGNQEKQELLDRYSDYVERCYNIGAADAGPPPF